MKKQLLILTVTITLAAFSTTSLGCTLGSTRSCKTNVAQGLTNQLVAELRAMGVTMSSLTDTSKFRCSSPCIPLLQEPAKNALEKATKSKNDFITLTSAYRSSAQQYLLYLQRAQGRCGRTLVAKPGTSNHESGAGIDVPAYNYWRATLEGLRWSWLGRRTRDKVHFDYKGARRMGVAKLSLKAFQRLWNRNNPRDKIAEDGVYGPNTATRLFRSPCNGW